MSRRAAVLCFVALAAFALPATAWATGGPAFTPGVTATAPTIDGTLGATEWANAHTYDIAFDNGAIPATVALEATPSALYVGVTVKDMNPGAAPSLDVLFDNNHNGVKDNGDDSWLSFVGQGGEDFYSISTQESQSDLSDPTSPGTNDTVAAATSSSGAVVFEIAHPLCSADTAHDVCMKPGDTVGLDFQYEPGALGVFYDAPGTNYQDPSQGWADLTLPAAPSVTLTAPAAGSTLSGTVPVSATVTGSTAVTSVHFQFFDGATKKFFDIGTVTSPPYTASFDTTTVPNTDVPLDATIYATATDAAGNTTTVGNGVTVKNPTGSLTGSLATGGVADANLTAQGAEDWAIWGYAGKGTSTSLAPDVRKAGGNAISDLTNIDPGASVPLRGIGQFPEPFTFDWSDPGTGGAVTGAQGGIQHDGEQTSTDTVGKGFSFTVPADRVVRTLRVYVSTNRADGQLTAKLSDGSAPGYTSVLPAATDTNEGVFTITYAAASPGQKLTVTWVETAGYCGSPYWCDNAALYAVALSEPTATSAQASLATASSVGMSGSNDPIAGLPLSAFEPTAPGATPAPINGLPINGLPINGLPINGLPINGLPINGLPINGLPINGLPINGLPINGLPINGLPINGLPLTTPGGWQAVLAGTSLAGIPLQTITLQQVLALQPAPQIKLGDLDLSTSALGQVTIGALALGATPINGLGLPSADLAPLVAWCQSVDTDPSQCTTSAVAGQSLFALSLAGAPINGLPINGLPINGLPINGLPINGLPINGLDLSASPINGLPINGLTLAGTPINGLSLEGIVTAHAPDGSASPFGSIHVADLAAKTGIDCTSIDCGTATLADAAAAGAIGAAATLADLGPAALGSLTVGDLHYYGNLTIGDLLPSLVGTQATLGDVIALLIRRADVPWETLDPRVLSVFDPARPKLGLTAAIDLAGSGFVPATVQVALPHGFDVVPGSATLAGAAVPDPVVAGDTATFALEVATGAPQSLHFDAYSGTDVGPAQASVTVTSGAATATSTASFQVADSFEPNDDPASANLPVLTPDTAVQQSAISSSGDVDYYRIPMPPAGTRLTVHLTNLPADYDLALYASRTTSVRTGATSGLPLQDGTVADTPVNLQGATNPQLAPTALQDYPNPGIPVVQVSANRGTDDEDVGMVSPGGGGYALVAVFGYGGAWSAKPYSLRVKTQAPPSISCPARHFDYSGTAGSLPSIDSLPTDLNTVVLVNEQRIGDTYGLQAENDVVSALGTLAGERTLGVSGAVVPVEAVAQAQYQAWDQNPCDVNAANAVANAIADEVDAIKAARPSLKYVVFAGGDDQIPFFRIPDLSLIANESGFAGEFAQNEYYGSLASGDLLTDDPYLDTRPIPATGRQLFVPDLLGGRLVEKPSQIVGAVNDFVASGGELARTSAFVSGYDFVNDGSQRVAGNLGSFLGSTHVSTLLSSDTPNWSKTTLLTDAFASGQASINDWNGHYDNYEALAADGDRGNLLTTADLTGTHAFSGGIFFTMGCHAGFQTTDAIVGSSAPDALDWAEKFATTGTQFVGNTGFGLGNTDSVAFSEELMADFAANLDGSMPIGRALAAAKQTYYLGRTAFSSYDEKTLAEAELYGLPMYGVGTPPQPVGAAGSAPPPASPDPVHGASSSTSPSQGSLSPLGVGNTQVASFSVTPAFSAVQHGANGDYLTNGGQVQAPNYRPLQPFVTLPATRPGTVAHGVLVDGLASSDLTPFNPDNVRPTVDLSANEPEPQFADEAWPAKVPTLVSLQTASGLSQSLDLATGQFFTDQSTNAGVEREWTQITGRVTYSSSSDFTPPTIDSIDAYIANGSVVFTGRFSDLTETGAAGTVGVAQVVYDSDNTGTWTALPLHRDPTTGVWSGGTAFSGSHVQFFVEACDTAGNCGFSSNKGRYFDAAPLPSAGGSISITPSRGPDVGTWYTGPLDVTASDSGSSAVSVSVDGSAFAPATGPVTLSGEGAHVVDARDAAGHETSAVFLVDAVGPVITHTVSPASPDGANGWYVSAPTVTFSCSDDVSGVAAGSCAVDGSSPASPSVTLGEKATPQTVSASARDNAGNTGHDAVSGLLVDLTNPSTPVFTGITASIYPVNDLPSATAIGCTSTDSGSGIHACVVTGYGSGLGSHTLTATATDNAGRTSTATLTYTVGFRVGNVLAPVTAPNGDQTNQLATDLQVFKINSTIPVKFRLYLDGAKTVLMTAPPAGAVARIAFGKADTSTDSVDTATLITATADSGNVFRWTGSPDYQYVYNLPTAGRVAGTYYVTLTLYASDGTTVLAQSAKQYFVLR